MLLLLAQIVLAQTVTPDGIGGLVAIFGPAGGLLAVAVVYLWRSNAQKDADNKALNAQILALLERWLPVTVEATVALNDAAQAMRGMVERTPTREEMDQLRKALDRARRQP